MTDSPKFAAFTRRALAFLALCFVIVIAAAIAIGMGAVDRIEANTRQTVERLIPVRDVGWVSPSYDGLRIGLAGQAPDEGAKGRVIEALSREININRIDDQITPPQMETQNPDILIEIVQNDEIASILGIIPREPSPLPLYRAMERANPGKQPLNLVQSALIAPSETWAAQLDFLAKLVEKIPSIKISATPTHATVRVIAASESAASELRAQILELAPTDVTVDLDIVAPRPLIAPFEFAVNRRADSYTLTRCAATSALEARQIAKVIPIDANTIVNECDFGLGAPTENWGLFVRSILEETNTINDFKLRIVDSLVSLDYASDTDATTAKTALDNIQGLLPPGFGLQSSTYLTTQSIAEIKADGGDLTLVMTKEEDGRITISGVVPSEIAMTNLQSYGAAIFGSADGRYDLKVVEGLLPSWEANAFAGINALNVLNFGKVTVNPELIVVSGEVSSVPAMRALEDALRADTSAVEISTDIMALAPAEPDPEQMATALSNTETASTTRVEGGAKTEPDQCLDAIATIITADPIIFEPGSTKLTDSARNTVDQIATLLVDCTDFAIEIGGHTDSQGSSGGNQTLSAARADAVRSALVEILPEVETRLSAHGYGEEKPIADNNTSDGRAKNRRIEFTRAGDTSGDSAALDGAAAASEGGSQ